MSTWGIYLPNDIKTTDYALNMLTSGVITSTPSVPKKKIVIPGLMHAKEGISEVWPSNIEYDDYEEDNGGSGDYNQNHKVIVLSGGGMDSFISIALYSAIFFKHHGIRVRPTFLVFNYGQPNFEEELAATNNQAKHFSHSVVQVIEDFAINQLMDKLTDDKNPVQELGQPKDYAPFIPQRNAKFIMTAALTAELEKRKMCTIILGAVGQGHPDNSRFLVQKVLDVIQYMNKTTHYRIYAPFAMLTKAIVARTAYELNILDLLPQVTTSCFLNSESLPKIKKKTKSFQGKILKNKIKMSTADFKALEVTPTDLEEMSEVETLIKFPVRQCGKCKSCMSLKGSFEFAGVNDPFTYVE